MCYKNYGDRKSCFRAVSLSVVKIEMTFIIPIEADLVTLTFLTISLSVELKHTTLLSSSSQSTGILQDVRYLSRSPPLTTEELRYIVPL